MMKTHRVCLPLPLYHCFASVLGVMCSSAHGAAVVLPSPVFSAREAVKTVSNERYSFSYSRSKEVG